MEIIGIFHSMLWAVLFAFLILRYVTNFSRTSLVLAIGLKVTGALLIEAIYTYYYTDRSTADIYRFFDDGMILHSIWSHSPSDFLRIISGIGMKPEFTQAYFEHMNSWIKPWDSGFYNDNHIMIRLHALMSFISFGYYSVHGVIFSMLSLVGLIWIIGFLEQERRTNSVALILVSILPSFLLWCSGGMKEALVVFGIGALFKSLSYLKPGGKLVLGSTAIIISIALLSQVKPYFLLCLMPVIIIYAISLRKKLSALGQLVTLMTIWLLGWALTSVVGVSVLDYIVLKQTEFINLAQHLSAGSSFELGRIEDSVWSIILHIPEAMVNVLLRPFPWDIGGAALMLLFLENALLILLGIVILYYRFTDKTKKGLPLWLLLWGLPILALIGLTTPVLGASMRYRAPVIIFVLIYASPFIESIVYTPNHKKT